MSERDFLERFLERFFWKASKKRFKLVESLHYQSLN